MTESKSLVWPDDGVTTRLLLSGRVKRYSVWPMIQEQTDGCHTWAVYIIYRAIFGVPSAQCAEYIMLHDAEELVVGDNPFPVKRLFPEVKRALASAEVIARARLGYKLPDISLVERARVKVADLLEMFCHGMREVEMGNRLAMAIVLRTEDAAVEHAQVYLNDEDQASMRGFLRTEWQRHSTIMLDEGPGAFAPPRGADYASRMNWHNSKERMYDGGKR